MIISIDTDTRRVAVSEGTDCKRLSAVVQGDGNLASAIDGFGWLDPDGAHLWIGVDRLRETAAPVGDLAWPAQFDGMIKYATSKGWVDTAGSSVRVHIARP